MKVQQRSVEQSSENLAVETKMIRTLRHVRKVKENRRTLHVSFFNLHQALFCCVFNMSLTGHLRMETMQGASLQERGHETKQSAVPSMPRQTS